MSQLMIKDSSTHAGLEKLKKRFEDCVHVLVSKSERLEANGCYESAAHHSGMAYAYLVASEQIQKLLNKLDP